MNQKQQFKLRLRIVDGHRTMIVEGKGVGIHIRLRKDDYNFMRDNVGLLEDKPLMLGIFKPTRYGVK